ncbi:MAG: hypothetical protein M3O02_11175 [Acidobacteriota bacterium]|nr:hypothetical protein [Acidobacteriota bacterium]
MNPALINSILTASVPTLMVVVALLLNRSDSRDLRTELRREIAELRTQQHNDMLRIYELFGEHGERISRLESRVLQH